MPSRRAAAIAPVVAAGAAILLAACGGGNDRGGTAPDAPGARYAAVPETRATAGPPGDLARAGEAIYGREHCDRCHTRFEAPPADGPFDLPRALPPTPGASRVGPDLGREGHRHSDDWHYAHLYAPDVVVPGSRMPASRHLFTTGSEGAPRPTADGERLVAWLQWLGRERRDVWAEFRAAEPDIPLPLPGEASDRRRARAPSLYVDHCAACHGAAGDGRGPAAALLARPPRDFTRARFRFRSVPLGEPLPDRDLFRSITIGSGTGAAMPSFAHLAAEDRWALVEAVQRFRIEAPEEGGGGPDPATTPGPRREPVAPVAGPDAAARGARLYAAWGCAACHGAAAEGHAAPAADPEAGPGWRDEADRPIAATADLRHACARRGGASPEALERALRFGVGQVMPSYAALLEAEPGSAAALDAWIRSLDPERSGAAGGR